MNINDLIDLAGNRDQIANVGRQFGLDESQTKTALEQLAPVIGAGVRRQAQQPQNLVSLLQALQNGHHDRYLDDPDAVGYESAAPEGNAILGHLFGSKDVSREIAMRASGNTGIGSSILKKLLPIIAAMVLGGIAKKAGAGMNRPAPAPAPDPQAQPGQGGFGDILSDIFGGGGQRRQGSPGTAPTPEPMQRRGTSEDFSDLAAGPRGDHDDMIEGAMGGDMGGSYQGDNPFGEAGDGGAFDDYDEDAFGRGRDIIDDIAGGRSREGNAADDLLNSVERHLRGLR